jgi:hypothetical protein
MRVAVVGLLLSPLTGCVEGPCVRAECIEGIEHPDLQLNRVDFPSATVVSTGTATYVFALEDGPDEDAILIATMRGPDLAAPLAPWTFDVVNPREILGWSGPQGALLQVFDQNGRHVLVLDDAATVVETTFALPIQAAMWDDGWWIVETVGDIVLRRLEDEEERVLTTLGPDEMILDVDAANGLVAWVELDGRSTTARVYSVATGTSAVFPARAGRSLTSIRVLPDRMNGVWLGYAQGSDVVTFDAALVETTRVAQQDPLPGALLALPGGLVGYTRAAFVRYVGAITDANRHILGANNGTVLGFAASGDDFVFVTLTEEDTIDGTASDGDGFAELFTLEGFSTEAGCAAGGSRGALRTVLLVGLAALVGVRRRR